MLAAAIASAMEDPWAKAKILCLGRIVVVTLFRSIFSFHECSPASLIVGKGSLSRRGLHRIQPCHDFDDVFIEIGQQ
jgi:hypothetical protein